MPKQTEMFLYRKLVINVEEIALFADKREEI